MKWSVVSAAVALLSSGASAQIPPTSFGLPTATEALSLRFTASNRTVTPGAHLGINVPVGPIVGPNRQVASTNNSTYVVLMIDPDAPTPQNASSAQILHWLQPGFRVQANNSLASNTTAVAAYRRPSPPTTSDPHRYLIYAYRQPSNFSVPAAFANFSDSNRTRFDLARFATAANLGQPVAATWFYATNQTFVPGLFYSPSNGSYPSSNGTGSSTSSGTARTTSTSATTPATTAPVVPVTTTSSSTTSTRSGAAATAAAMGAGSFAALVLGGLAIVA